MRGIVSETRRMVNCTEAEQRDCFALLRRCFLGVTWAEFERDFREKEAVILLRRAENGQIVGFSTLMVLPLSQEDAITAIFSGDTAVLPPYRSSFGMGVEIGRYFLDVYEAYRSQAIYYILISKGW